MSRCKGANDGTITISSPSGGSGTYQYSVDGGISWWEQAISPTWYLLHTTYGYAMRPTLLVRQYFILTW